MRCICSVGLLDFLTKVLSLSPIKKPGIIVNTETYLLEVILSQDLNQKENCFLSGAHATETVEVKF